MTASASLSKRLPTWSLGLVFGVTIVTALLFTSVLPASLRSNESSDYTSSYQPVAQNLLAGRGLVDGQNQVAIRYPPGYPFLLAATFALARPLGLADEAAASVLNLLGIGLTSTLLFCLTRTVWGLTPALLGIVVWITYPVALWLTKQPNSEIPFMVLFYAMLYLFYQSLQAHSHAWPGYLLVGVLAGCAALIRPIAVGVPLILCLILWLTSTHLKARTRLFLVGMLVVGNLMVMLPWEAWIYARTGNIVMLSTAGVAAMRDGLTFTNPKGYREAVPVPTDVTEVIEHVTAKRRELQSLNDIVRVLQTEWQVNPLAVVKLLALKAARSWYATDSGRFESLILLVQLGYLALILRGSWMAWQQGGNTRGIMVGIWLLTLYFWAMTIMALSILRYMVPVLGLLVVLIPGRCIKFPLQLGKLDRLENRLEL